MVTQTCSISLVCRCKQTGRSCSILMILFFAILVRGNQADMSGNSMTPLYATILRYKVIANGRTEVCLGGQKEVTFWLLKQD